MTMNTGDGTPPAEWLDGPAPPAVSGAVAALYAEIAATLRMPFLVPFWRPLAWEPESFARLWSAVRPLLVRRDVEQEAAALRRAALIEEAVTMPSHQAFKGDLVRSEIDYEMRERIANYNAAVHYALPKTLLVATWLLAPPSDGASGAAPGDEIPTGIAPGAVAVTPAPPEQVRGRLADLLEEIPRAHGHPIADEYFRAIGRLTDYLNAAWNAIQPIVRDEPYDARGRELVQLAEAAIARLPGAGAPPPFSDDPAATARFRSIATYFARRHLPDLLIDVAMIKGLTDGPERAQLSPFDLET